MASHTVLVDPGPRTRTPAPPLDRAPAAGGPGFDWLMAALGAWLIGGLYLLWLPYHHFFRGGDAQERRTPPKATPWLGLSAFWATVVKVELTDIVFAIDSILVAVAMSPKLWVIITGGVLGIIAMRMVIGQLLAIVRR